MVAKGMSMIKCVFTSVFTFVVLSLVYYWISEGVAIAGEQRTDKDLESVINTIFTLEKSNGELPTSLTNKHGASELIHRL